MSVNDNKKYNNKFYYGRSQDTSRDYDCDEHSNDWDYDKCCKHSNDCDCDKCCKHSNDCDYNNCYKYSNDCDCDDCCQHCNDWNCHECCNCCECCETKNKSTGHIGTRECEVCIPGITGGIPFNRVFSRTGKNISGANPIELIGPHTYLIEWSTAIDPIDSDATARLRLLLDDKPVRGSDNFTEITAKIDGFAPLSGGAIVNVPSGVHELKLEAITGKKGALASNSNVRIVQII